MRTRILLALIVFAFLSSCSTGPYDGVNEASFSGNTDNNFLTDNE